MKPRPAGFLRLAVVVAVCAVTALGATAGAGARQTDAVLERFTALAINTGSIGRPGAGTVEIVVTRWSTASERQTLIDALLDHGPDALLDRLRATPRVGYFRTPNRLGYDLHYAQAVPGEDGGRRIVLATDRRIGFWEATNRPRTIDYPFTLIELHMNRDGVGEGKMSIATRITGSRTFNLIELENYGTEPVRLTSVRSSRPTS